MRTAHLLAVAVLAVPLLAARPALAQTASDKALARTLADEGEAAIAKKDYATALQKFTKANQLVPSIPTLLLGLARAQAGVGRLVEARESYNLVVRQELAAGAPAPFKDAQKAAIAEMPEVSAKIGRLEIIVVGGASPAVTLDGEPVSAAMLGEKRPTNPGVHVIKATAAGFRDAEAKVTLKPAGSESITLKLEAGAAGPVATSAPPPAPEAPEVSPDKLPPPPPASATPWRTVGFVGLGVGGVGLAVGAVTGIIALGKHSDLEKSCRADGHCRTGQAGDVDSLKTMSTISTVGFIVGGVAAAGGAGLLLFAPKTTSASVGLQVGPGWGALHGSF